MQICFCHCFVCHHFNLSPLQFVVLDMPNCRHSACCSFVATVRTWNQSRSRRISVNL